MTTSYPKNYQPAPYNADILYGTFLEFEGDYLDEITSTRKIRGKRGYQVIIIDEVDNLFIDNILGSTRLTNSSKGFKFLAPYYFTTYLSVLLVDFASKLYTKIRLESIKDKKMKEKFESKLNDAKERKKEIMKVMTEIFQMRENQIDNNENTSIENTQNLTEEIPLFFQKFLKYIEFPNFMKDFVNTEEKLWMDSAYYAENEMNENYDYVVTYDKEGNKDIAPVDRNNTGEIELSTVYDEGIHQMLEIKNRLRLKEETIVHTFLSHITFFHNYYKKDNEFLFFGLSGTIGNKDTQKIYETRYHSKTMFIPPYKRKRFVELPPIICQDKKEHYKRICQDILYNYNKGRKVL